MKLSTTRWLVGTAALLILLALGVYRYLLPRSFLLTSGDWRTSWSGFTYRLRFNKDGTMTVRDDHNVWMGTYTVSSQGIVSTHIMPVVPWGEVGNLRFSRDGNALIFMGSPIGNPAKVIRYDHH